MRRLLIGLVAAVLLTGCGGSVTEPPSSTPPAQVTVTAPATPAHAYGPPLVAITPHHLMLRGIDAEVIPLALTGSELVPPDDPRVLGWWGRKASALHGTTLLVGHTVHTGGGTLDDLEDVPLGSTAKVSGVRYTVTSNEVISKAALAKRAPSLFDQSGPHRLVVVTCEGYNPATGHYASNVVLTAQPLYYR